MIARELVADIYSELIAEIVVLVLVGISACSRHVGGGESGTLWPADAALRDGAAEAACSQKSFASQWRRSTVPATARADRACSGLSDRVHR